MTGDGGFAQYMAELTTAVKHEMNPMLNKPARISKEQRAGEWEVWQTQLHNPNFADYATNCGAHGERVTDPARLDDAIASARPPPRWSRRSRTPTWSELQGPDRIAARWVAS